MLAAVLTIGLCQACTAQDFDLAPLGAVPPPSAPVSGPTTLFQNVRIFDGKSATLSAPSNVLVKNNIIERISANPITVAANAIVIAGNGRVLMPGLIDAHWHSFMAGTPQMLLMTAPSDYLLLLAARQAETTLMQGFTTVRDLGGPVFGLKRAIDEGCHRWPAHLSFRCHDFSDIRTWRLPVRLRSAAAVRRAFEPLRS